jgi:hypothetical protein
MDSDFTWMTRLDRRKGTTAEITRKFDASASDWAISADGLVYFHAESRGKVHLYVVP